jgi:hypothetical protein
MHLQFSRLATPYSMHKNCHLGARLAFSSSSSLACVGAVRGDELFRLNAAAAAVLIEEVPVPLLALDEAGLRGVCVGDNCKNARISGNADELMWRWWMSGNADEPMWRWWREKLPCDLVDSRENFLSRDNLHLAIPLFF